MKQADRRRSRRSCILAALLAVSLAVSLAGSTSYAQEQDLLSLRALPLPGGAGAQRRLTVELRADHRCTFGDIDLMRLDLAAVPNQNDVDIQLDVEVLGSAKDEVFYGAGDIADGKFSVVLPEFKTPALLGVFLCGAAKGGARTPCSKRKPQSFDEMFARYDVIKSKEARLPRLEAAAMAQRLYFFRFMIARGQELLVPAAPMNNERYDALMSLLSREKAAVADAAGLRKIVESFSSTLASEPLAPGDGTLLLTLPVFNHEKCMK